MDWNEIIKTQGFAIVFGLVVLALAAKYAPAFIKAWTDFSVAISNLTKSVDTNTAVTDKQFKESLDVKTQLEVLNEKLSGRDSLFQQNRKDHEEMLRIVKEMERKLNEFLKNERG